MDNTKNDVVYNNYLSAVSYQYATNIRMPLFRN